MAKEGKSDSLMFSLEPEEMRGLGGGMRPDEMFRELPLDSCGRLTVVDGEDEELVVVVVEGVDEGMGLVTVMAGVAEGVEEAVEDVGREESGFLSLLVVVEVVGVVEAACFAVSVLMLAALADVLVVVVVVGEKEVAEGVGVNAEVGAALEWREDVVEVVEMEDEWLEDSLPRLPYLAPSPLSRLIVTPILGPVPNPESKLGLCVRVPKLSAPKLVTK